MPPSDAARWLVRARSGLQIMQLHWLLPSFAGSSTRSRNATRRSIPRLAGVSASSMVWLSRCSPRARMVPRAPALWPIVDFTQVTRKAPSLAATAASHREGWGRPLDVLVRLAGGLGGTLAHQFLGSLAAPRRDRVCGAQGAERLDRGTHHVDRVGAAHRLAEQVADAGR